MLVLPRRARMLYLVALVAVFTVTAHADGLSATGTYTYSEVSPGVYDYSISVNNTGTTNIETFFFAWIPGTGFLSALPTDVNSPTGWTDTIKPAVAGKAGIEWTTTADPLDPGDFLTSFSFESTETPAQMLLDFTGSPGTGDPVTTSTISMTSGVPMAGSDYILDVTVTPEPPTMILTLAGLILAAASFKSRLLRRA